MPKAENRVLKAAAAVGAGLGLFGDLHHVRAQNYLLFHTLCYSGMGVAINISVDAPTQWSRSWLT